MAAAAAGLDHVGSIDHVCFRGGEGIDGLITAAALAGIHPNIGLYVGVYQLPLRHPVLVARQLSTLAHFAPGRLTFGIGVAGEDAHEFEHCGVDGPLALLRRLLPGGSVTFEGEFFQLREPRILPAPRPPIPLIIGGRSDASMRRAGVLGDGWIGAFNSARRFSEAATIVAEHADRVGRGSVGWQHAMEVWCGFDTNVEAARDRLADTMQRFYGLPYESFERYCPAGRPEHVSQHLAPFLAAGGQNFNLIPIAASVDDAIDGAVQVKRSLVGSSP